MYSSHTYVHAAAIEYGYKMLIRISERTSFYLSLRVNVPVCVWAHAPAIRFFFLLLLLLSTGLLYALILSIDPIMNAKDSVFGLLTFFLSSAVKSRRNKKKKV